VRRDNPHLGGTRVEGKGSRVRLKTLGSAGKRKKKNGILGILQAKASNALKKGLWGGNSLTLQWANAWGTNTKVLMRR